ncbi:MAG: formate/nitrite transporter family protein [Clostridiales bacterium]|nr:formate/nitrite transporter family protein [Clostridiales bacterium]
MRKHVRDFFEGILAGLMVTIGCGVFLGCENKVVGSVLFSVALLSICFKGFNLFTGKIGLIVNDHSKSAVSTLLLGLLGNLVGMFVFGTALTYAIPSMHVTAEALCLGKLANQELWQTLIRAVFCGVLMYLAVITFRENKTIAGILFCIPVFILSGYEHSIADMGYFAISRIYSLEAFIFIMVVIAGNTIGGMLIPMLKLIGKEKIEDEVK